MASNSINKLIEGGSVWKASSPAAPSFKKPNQRRALVASTGVDEIDKSLPIGGLPFGAVHEFSLDNVLTEQSSHSWFPPVEVLLQVIAATATKLSTPTVLWIGKRTWPSTHVLERAVPEIWRKNFFFIDPPDKKSRLTAIIEGLSSEAISIVIADGSSMSFLATQRMQLAARNHLALGLIIRPPWELGMSSASYSKWNITPQALHNSSTAHYWELTLERLRGISGKRSWLIEGSDETSALHLLQKNNGLEKPHTGFNQLSSEVA